MTDESPAREPDAAAQEEARRASDRLRRVIAVALILLCALSCLVLGTELVMEVALVLEARANAGAAGGPSMVPTIQANVTLNPLLVLEVAVVEPLFLFAAAGLVAFDRRRSWLLSIAGIVAYNLGAIGFVVFGTALDAHWSSRADLLAWVSVFIGLPIAEFALWTLFRPSERARFLV